MSLGSPRGPPDTRRLDAGYAGTDRNGFRLLRYGQGGRMEPACGRLLYGVCVARFLPTSTHHSSMSVRGKRMLSQHREAEIVFYEMVGYIACCRPRR